MCLASNGVVPEAHRRLPHTARVGDVNECVSYTPIGQVAVVHLNRPERHNAVVPALVDDLLPSF